MAFGSLPAQSVRVVNSNEIQAVTPVASSGKVTVTVQESDGQVAAVPNAFTFTAPVTASPSEATAVSADVIVDASQTVSETGGDDLAAAKNIYRERFSAGIRWGSYPDWNLISSAVCDETDEKHQWAWRLRRERQRKTHGCSRLDNDLSNMSHFDLTPHVVVGQWAPASIGGNPLQWGPAQWAQYDALCYAIVNYVANQFGGTGFSEALFEVENEMDTTTIPGICG